MITDRAPVCSKSNIKKIHERVFKVYLKTKHIDLSFFAESIDKIEKNEIIDEDAYRYDDNYIFSQMNNFEEIEICVAALYEKFNLMYDKIENPFI